MQDEEPMIATRCPMCHAGGLLDHFVPQPGKPVDAEAIRCSSCGTTYPALKGVPFLATYGPDDVVRLVETLAHLDGASSELFNSAPQAAASSPDSYHNVLYRALRSYWAGEEESVVLKNAGYEGKPWWWNARRTEFQMFCWQTNGLTFAGKTVVDVGAGSGVDAMLFHDLGANVIAIEPDFITMCHGVDACPELQWLGGVAETLPLASDSVDYVVANASLHHQHDLAVSLPEMLRVLRCGGQLLTLGDPFKASASVPLKEDWLEFDTQASVLRGINEQILRLDTLFSILAAYGEALETRVFLDVLSQNSKREMSLSEAMKFVEQEPRTGGCVGLRVKKKAPIPLEVPPTRGAGSFRPSQLLEAVANGSGNLFRFVDDLVGEEQVGTDLFKTEQERWLQQNGWRMLSPSHSGLRLAYERGRLFLPRVEKASGCLIVEWMAPDCAPHTDVEVEVAANGISLRRVTTGRGVWHRWCLPLDHPGLAGRRLIVELSLPLCARNTWSELQPENHLAVRRFEVSLEPVPESSWLSPEPSLSALLRSEQGEEGPILCCGPDGDAAMLVLREIRRQTGRSVLSIFAGEDQRSFFSAVPWLKVAGIEENGSLPEGGAQTLFFVLGCPRNSELLQKISLKAPQRAWWFDRQGCPLNAASLGLAALRDTLEGRQSPGAAQPRDLAKEVEGYKARLREAKAKLAGVREKHQKLKAKVASEREAKSARRNWMSRLLKG